MFLVALTGVCGMMGTVPADDDAAPRPNIVVLLCDDPGYGDLGCFGHSRIQTPAIDRLATEGIRLTSLYAGAPVCSPSRAALFSGQNPNRLGIRDWISADSGVHLPRSTVTVARRLREAGYTTCLSGKWHLNSRFDGQEPTPGDFGFDHWFATQNNTRHQDPANFVRNGKRVGQFEGHATTLVVDEAIQFIDQANREGGRPFAVFVTFHAPHEQVETPEAFRSRYADLADPTMRDYYGSVSLVDHEVGRLMEALDARKLREGTLILCTSDNGPEGLRRYPAATHSHGSAAPLRGMKLSMYEGGLRVPGVVRWPGRVKPGSKCDEPIAFYDLLPTLCAVAGITPPPSEEEGAPTLDGVKLLPLLERGGRIERPVPPLHWQYDLATDGPWRIALRRWRWKLLADAGCQQFVLYDLEQDIAEAHDLAAERPEVIAQLRTELEQRSVPPTAN